MRQRPSWIAPVLAAVLFIPALRSHAADDPLATGFRNPPASARPHTWWHWMDGNITREGITADLEAMKKAGIGGAQMFHVSQGIPPGPVGYNSPKWREMVAHAVKEADRLGLELCIHNCAGWSSSGGPWIDPAHAMQVIAWSTRAVQGPAHFSEELPEAKAPQVVRHIPFYRDIAVLAFGTPAEGEVAAPAGQILGKTGVVRQDGLQPDTSPTPAGIAIPRDGIVDVTSKLDASGRLTWDVPDGNWTILRLGYTPTGKDNHPAPPEGDGLEVDKLSREALDVHWNGMMAKVIAECGPLAGKVLNNSLIDSYEVGSQNWTPLMRDEFRKRRGYDLLPFLPVITGRIVESKETSERFLWDFRRTIADLYADNYFGYFAELCHKAGMKMSTEPYGNGLFDNMQSGGRADIPMGEFWVGGGTLETTKLASSIGHVYGRKIVGAESFTADEQRGRWLVEPYGIKALGDLVFTNGINRYIFHRYAMQPWLNRKPGMTMGPWGTHLERTVTWWDEAPAWLRYVARCQFMLQEGRFAADALYFYGEGAPNDLPYRPYLRPQIPAGHDYDGCDATILLQKASVKGGNIVLQDGMTYRVLVLPDTKFMTPELARKIRELVQAGALVVGPKPQQSSSLMGYPACDDEVARIGDEVWGGVDGQTVTEHAFGKGRVIWGKKLDDLFASMKVAPDFTYTSKSGARLAYIHRHASEWSAYFVSNQRYKPAEVECSFNTSGWVPELWHADSGVIEPAPVYREEGARTVVPMRLDPAESVFVVFRKPARSDHVTALTLLGQAQETERTPQVAVLKARYETDDGRGADVTERVADMVKEGQYEIPATNEAYGDPVPNVVKHLTVEYSVDGKAMKKVAAENETVTLVDIAEGPAGFPLYTLASGAAGDVTLLPWKEGTFDVQTSDGRSRRVRVAEAAHTLEVTGSWALQFPSGWGAPAAVQLDKLISWPDHPDAGVRYFSGTATYQKDIVVPAGLVGSGRTVWLDLGRVKNFAQVRLNGKDLGILWKEPFRLDVTNELRQGRNHLEVKVTNLWPNRLIGDEQLPADVEWDGTHLKKWPDWLIEGKPRPSGRFTFTTWHFYTKDSPLLESGLIGPVTLRSAKRVQIIGRSANVGSPPRVASRQHAFR